jgi:hypothetical protein
LHRHKLVHTTVSGARIPTWRWSSSKATGQTYLHCLER